MSKCCLYCRVDGASTESNRLAINQQLTALRSLARQLGFSISTERLGRKPTEHSNADP